MFGCSQTCCFNLFIEALLRAMEFQKECRGDRVGKRAEPVARINHHVVQKLCTDRTHREQMCVKIGVKMGRFFSYGIYFVVEWIFPHQKVILILFPELRLGFIPPSCRLLSFYCRYPVSRANQRSFIPSLFCLETESSQTPLIFPPSLCGCFILY